MKKKQPKNIHPWFGYQIGNKFSELKASAESGHLPALLDALHLADELRVNRKWLKPLIKAFLLELLKPGGTDLLKKKLVALHSDFDGLCRAFRLARVGVSNQRGPRCCEASLVAL
jgi:hypothetical protein